MSETLAGKVALITGSTNGIGRATALELADRGATVLVVGRDEQRGQKVVDEIVAAGGKADLLLADLSDAASARDLAERALAGGRQVDILVNNAGIAAMGPTLDATEADFDSNFNVNVKAPYFLTAALVPGMVERGAGAVVNISTMVASFGQPGMAIYGASKAALELLTKSWAAEFGPSGVRVNAVAPGPIETERMAGNEMIAQLATTLPARRAGTTQEVAAAVAYLVGDEAGFTHGVVLHVDGGRTAV